MPHRVLRHGARPAGDAREPGTRGHAGDLAQFLASPPRVTASSLSPSTPASSMPPRKQRATTLPSGTRYENFVPTQVHATRRRRSFLGTRKPNPEGRLRKVRGVEPHRHRHRRTVRHLSHQFRQARIHRPEQGANRYAPRTPPPRRSASSHSPSTRTRNPAAVRSTVSARAWRTVDFAPDRCLDRTHQLSQPALQSAEQRSRRLRFGSLRARGQHAARQAAVPCGQFDKSRQYRGHAEFTRIAAVNSAEQRFGQIVHRLLPIVLAHEIRHRFVAGLHLGRRAAVPSPCGSSCPCSAGG